MQYKEVFVKEKIRITFSELFKLLKKISSIFCSKDR
jgi:hypothetical protein